MTTPVIIYIIGIIPTYIIIKLWRNQVDANGWLDVLLTLFFSLMSYIALVIFLAFYLDIKYDGSTSNKLPKPPKWL